MSRSSDSRRCKWLTNIIEVVYFNITVFFKIVCRSKTKQFIKVINCDTLMKICHKDCFWLLFCCCCCCWYSCFCCWCCYCRVWCCNSCCCCCCYFPFCCCSRSVVAAVASDFETDDVDFAVAWYFLKTIANYFVDHDDVVESAVCRLHLTNSVDLAVFL